MKKLILIASISSLVAIIFMISFGSFIADNDVYVKNGTTYLNHDDYMTSIFLESIAGISWGVQLITGIIILRKLNNPDVVDRKWAKINGILSILPFTFFVVSVTGFISYKKEKNGFSSLKEQSKKITSKTIDEELNEIEELLNKNTITKSEHSLMRKKIIEKHADK